MASQEEVWWHDFIAREGEPWRRQQKENVLHSAHLAVRTADQRKRELANAVAKSSSANKIFLSRILHFAEVQRLLSVALRRDKASPGGGNGLDSLLADTKLRRMLETYALACESQNNCDTGEAPAVQALNASAKYAKDALDSSTPLPRPTWKDMPKEELQERLAKGEIAPIDDQWIPGVSDGKRKLTNVELEKHISFADEIDEAARRAFADGLYDQALTKYTQGVRLFEWVDGFDDDSVEAVRERLSRFLKNQALAALKACAWSEAKKAADRAVEMDEHDSKAVYRRAKASLMLGDVEAATADYRSILASPFADETSRRAAVAGLKECRSVKGKWAEKMRGFLVKSAESATFSEGRSSPSIDPVSRNSLSEEATFAASSAKDASASEQRKWRATSAPPQLDADQTELLLRDIIELYVSDSFESALREMRQEADFDERRLLLRLRKRLPSLLGPTLAKHGLQDEDFAVNKAEMEKAIRVRGAERPAILDLAKEAYQTVLGQAG